MFLGGIGIDRSSTPILEVTGPQQDSIFPPEVSPIVTLEGVISPPRDAEPVHNLALVTGASGVKPSARVSFVIVEGGPGLEVLNPDDFVLRPEASPRPRLSSRVERLSSRWPGGPLEEVEARLEAVALQVGS